MVLHYRWSHFHHTFNTFLEDFSVDKLENKAYIFASNDLRFFGEESIRSILIIINYLLFMINSKSKGVAESIIAPAVIAITALLFIGAMVPGAAHAAPGHATEYVNANATTTKQNGSLDYPFHTINQALATLNASTSNATTTIQVAAGTYNEDLTIPQRALTITGAGPTQTIINSDGSSQYGINDTGYHQFTLTGVTFNVSPSDPTILYAFHAFATNLVVLSNDVFNGVAQNASGAPVDGVEINTTPRATLDTVTSQGFGKDGFSITSKYIATDTHNTNTVTFNNILSTHNSSDGIGFYTVADQNLSSTTGAHRILGVAFTGMNTISNNGNGILLQGASDADYQAKNPPLYVIVSDAPKQLSQNTLDISHVNFDQNFAHSIINYQIASVNAVGSEFNGLTGAQMTQTQQAQTEQRIYDQLDQSNLGLVTFF